MKKETICKFLNLISLILLVAFIVFLFIDYSFYINSGTSAPFSVFILVRSLEFILPSIVIFIISKIIKKKYNK